MFADFGAKLPAPTQFLIDLSDFMKAWWWALGIGAYVVFVVVSKYVKTPAGRRQKDQFLVRAPIFGNLVHKIALSRFCRTYATLMRSGVPILRTLEIVSSASGKVQIEGARGPLTATKARSDGGGLRDLVDGLQQALASLPVVARPACPAARHLAYHAARLGIPVTIVIGAFWRGAVPAAIAQRRPRLGASSRSA